MPISPMTLGDSEVDMTLRNLKLWAGTIMHSQPVLAPLVWSMKVVFCG